ncbi:MAG TPA: hypothetical protein PK560_09610 [bacterium]|nr:hypothetical protein [bacterium]
MRAFLISVLILTVFSVVSCDSGSIKSTKPKPDSDSTAKIDTENTDSEEDVVIDENVKPDEDTNINAVCGDGNVEGSEVCEKEDVINCVEINEKLYEGGKAKCLADCSNWDTLTCDEVFMECGNTIVEGIEVCDGNTMDCHDLNPEKYESGTATCGLLCDSWNESNCVTYKPSVCENGEITGKEVCEKEAVISCVEINEVLYGSGKAKCLENCKGWDTETCIENEFPDDDVIECSDECFKLNSVRCDGSNVVKCQLSGGCLKWVQNKDCSTTSRLCADGNTVGFGTTGTERTNVYRGNFIEATSNATIYEFSMDIDNATGQPLIFAVYESDTSDGTYLPIATRSVDEPGTGRKMYSSGPIKKTGAAENVTVTAGKFYVFGVAWANAMTSYYASYDGFFNPFVSHTTTFGNTLGGTALTDSYPLLASIAGTNKGLSNYNMFFNTGNTSTEICACNNLCPALNDKRCSSNWIENCVADSYGCLSWEAVTDCDYKDCETNNGVTECVNNCVNECTLNNKQCNGNEIEKCTANAVHGCTEWTFETDCSISMITPYCGKDGTTSAKCYGTPQPSQEYIASEATNFFTTTSTTFRGVYISADKKGVITGFKFHLQQPSSGSISVPFVIYEGSSTSGDYTRIYRSTHTVGANGYYGPTGISVNISSGKYYIFGFHAQTGMGLYNITKTDYYLKFGQSVGNENMGTEIEPVAAYTFDGPSTFSYRMWIESYLN